MVLRMFYFALREAIDERQARFFEERPAELLQSIEVKGVRIAM